MNDPTSVKSGSKKIGHNQAMASAIDAHFAANPTASVSFGGVTYTDTTKDMLKTNIGIK